MEKNKRGIGLITCDRPDFFFKSYDSLILGLKHQTDFEIVVVNDGLDNIGGVKHHYIKTSGKTGVANAKNQALQYLLDQGCEHIFLMEDDVTIKDEAVFDAYINTSLATGIKHLNFALHGNHNRDQNGNIMLLKTVNYGPVEIDLYYNVLGAFSYYHRSVLEDIGLMPTDYFNALEHVCHTYRASVKGYTSPWRYFADIHNSNQYLRDIVPDHQQSKIRNEADFQKNFMKSLDVFIKKNGFSVIQGYGPAETITPLDKCIEKLKKIYNETR